MRKILKWLMIVILVGLLVSGYKFYKFADRAINGVEDYDLERPHVNFNPIKPNILVFTKTNGYRHGDAIEASIPVFERLCNDQGWNMLHSDNGAIFNDEDLSQLDLVIWNNATGPVLTQEQQQSMRNYIESGGGYLGVHAAGDGSHKWAWYRQNIIGAEYSHHPMNPQFQEAKMTLECDTSSFICENFTSSWDRTDEWYIFKTNPRHNGMNILYTVDESTINPDGEFLFMGRDKKQGMGRDHPIVWYNHVGKGRAFYSAIGHTPQSWNEPEHLQIIINAMLWAGRLNE